MGLMFSQAYGEKYLPAEEKERGPEMMTSCSMTARSARASGQS